MEVSIRLSEERAFMMSGWEARIKVDGSLGSMGMKWSAMSLVRMS
jgi:hypothetical protein